MCVCGVCACGLLPPCRDTDTYMCVCIATPPPCSRTPCAFSSTTTHNAHTIHTQYTHTHIAAPQRSSAAPAPSEAASHAHTHAHTHTHTHTHMLTHRHRHRHRHTQTHVHAHAAARASEAASLVKAVSLRRCSLPLNT